MKRIFLNNLFLVAGLNLLIKPIYIFGIDAEMQNRLGGEVYGNYFALLNFSFLLNIVLDFGLSNYNTRQVASDPKSITGNFYSILSLRILLFGAYIILTTIGALTVGYDQEQIYLLGILAVNQFLVAVIQFCRSNFAGLYLFRTDSIISVLDRFLLIVICSLLLWTNLFGGQLKIEWFVMAQTLAYAVTTIISLMLLANKCGKFSIRFRHPILKTHFRKTLPYANLILLMMLYSRIDAVLLERMLSDGQSEAGIYAQGFRILDAVNMFALLFAGLLLPIFSRQIANRESVEEIFSVSLRLLGSVAIVTSVLFFIYRHDLIHLLYREGFNYSSSVFGQLILGFIPVALGYIFGTLLTANGSLRILNVISLLALLINVVLNIVFIPHGKAYAAANVALITQWTVVLLQIAFVYRIFRFRFHYRILLSLVGLAALIYGMQIALDEFTDLRNSFEIVFILSACLAFLITTRLFSASDIKILMSRRDKE